MSDKPNGCPGLVTSHEVVPTGLLDEWKRRALTAEAALAEVTRFVICNENGSQVYYVNAQPDFEWRISKAGDTTGYVAVGLTRDAALARARELAGKGGG